MLIETVRPDHIQNGFAFGLLPGWWLSKEDYRQQSPCVSEQRWDDILRNNDFSGVDLEFRDSKENEYHHWSIMISTATGIPESSSGSQAVFIVARPESELNRTWLGRFKLALNH